jgi:hypothetical protein
MHVLDQRASERGLAGAEEGNSDYLDHATHKRPVEWNPLAYSSGMMEVRELNAMIPQLLDRGAAEELEVVVGVPRVGLGPRCSSMRKHNQTDPVARRGRRSTVVVPCQLAFGVGVLQSNLVLVCCCNS